MTEEKNIIYDTRWLGPHGIGRFAMEVYKSELHLEKINIKSTPASAYDPILLSFYLILKLKRKLFFSPGYNAPLVKLGKTIITVHDLNHIDIDLNSSLLKKIYYSVVLKRACRKVPIILTVSEFTKNRIRDWTGVDARKIHNVGNGVSKDFNEHALPYKSERPYYLIVGNRKKHKNEILSLMAYNEINDRNYNVYITGKSCPEIESFIIKNSLEDNVFFKDATKDKDLASLYKGAHCLLFPSLYEGFGLPVVEAMACGTAVITSNTSSLPEVSGGAAVLVNPESLEDMINAMMKIKNDDKFRKGLIMKGLLVAQKYNWDEVRKKVSIAIGKLQ